MGEIIGYLMGAFVPLTIWFFDRRRNKKKADLEIQKVQLEVQQLKQKKKESDLRVVDLEKKQEETIQKLQYIDRMFDLEFVNDLYNAVDNIFENTKADRFLILLAKNGKTDFNVVNVVFERHKDKKFQMNAVATYRNVIIDTVYKDMLKEAELRGVVELETEKMPHCILKMFYENEGIKHSKVRHLARQPIDENNDFLLFSSLATHEDEKFTDNELAQIKTQYEGIIIPSLHKVMT